MSFQNKQNKKVLLWELKKGLENSIYENVHCNRKQYLIFCKKITDKKKKNTKKQKNTKKKAILYKSAHLFYNCYKTQCAP